MTDLVKLALDEFKFDPHYKIVQDLCAEIERLREEVLRLEEATTDQHVTIHGLKQDVESLEGSLKNVRYAVIDDVREFASTYETWPTSPSEFLDAYDKDRMK